MENKSLFKVISEMMKAVNGKEYEITQLSKVDDFPHVEEYQPIINAFSTKVLYNPNSSEVMIDHYTLTYDDSVDNYFNSDSAFYNYIYYKAIDYTQSANQVIVDELYSSEWRKLSENSDLPNIFNASSNFMILPTDSASYLGFLPLSGLIAFDDIDNHRVLIFGLDIKCLSNQEFLNSLNLTFAQSLRNKFDLTILDSNDDVITDVVGFADSSYLSAEPATDDQSANAFILFKHENSAQIINGVVSLSVTADTMLDSRLATFELSTPDPSDEPTPIIAP